jgi:hypothetical protein
VFGSFFQQFGQFGGMASAGFTQTYKCRSVAFHKPDMENGGKSEVERVGQRRSTH